MLNPILVEDIFLSRIDKLPWFNFLLSKDIQGQLTFLLSVM